jgi:Domain of unknown function (DUF4440)
MSSVAAELDAMHDMSRTAFERGDFAAYRDVFSPDLKYRRADGRVVNRDSLVRDARIQYARYRLARTSIVREALDVEDDRATETVTRTVTAGATAFFVLHRTWEYVVKGRYTWRKVEDRWRIEEIEVLEQRVRPGRFSFGLRPRSQP